MSPPDPFSTPPVQDEASPWWSTLVVALVLTLAAVSAGWLAGGVA